MSSTGGTAEWRKLADSWLDSDCAYRPHIREFRDALRAAADRVDELAKLNSDMVSGHIVYGRAMVPAESSELLKRAEQAEAELSRLSGEVVSLRETTARVTAEAAVTREAIREYEQAKEARKYETYWVKQRGDATNRRYFAAYEALRAIAALSSTSAGAGLLEAARELPVLRKRLEASEATLECFREFGDAGLVLESSGKLACERYQAWCRAKGEPK